MLLIIHVTFILILIILRAPLGVFYSTGGNVMRDTTVTMDTFVFNNVLRVHPFICDGQRCVTTLVYKQVRCRAGVVGDVQASQQDITNRSLIITYRSCLIL